MRILFVLENYYPNIGGVETLFKSLAEALAKNGYQVTVFTNKFSSELKSKEEVNGVHVHRVNLKNRYFFTFLSLFKLIPFARKSDLIHTTSYNAGLPSYLAGKITNTKTIITFHEVWGSLWKELPFIGFLSSKLHYLFEWFLLKLNFTKFIAVSDYTKNQLQLSGIKSDRLLRIYNGIDYSNFKTSIRKVPNDKYTFTYFGRLGISKGLDLLIDAATELKENGHDYLLKLIIPTEPSGFHKLIRQLIRKNNLDGNVVIKSNLDKSTLFNEIQQSDAVVIPSYSEGFCYSAVETMALGVPIISSGKGALKEVVTGKHLTMKEHNSSELSNLMVKAMQDQWLITENQEYHLSSSVVQYIKCYEELIDKHA